MTLWFARRSVKSTTSYVSLTTVMTQSFSVYAIHDIYYCHTWKFIFLEVKMETY
jgi:hypothetical protein